MKISPSVMSNSLWLHGLEPTRLLCPWNSPDKNTTGVGCHFLLQGIFPTQGSNPGLPHYTLQADFTDWATGEATATTCIVSNHYEHFLLLLLQLNARRTVDERMGFPDGSDGKESACNAGDLGAVPGLERSPGKGNGNPLQYSCLENSMDRGAWRPTVCWFSKSRTRMSNYH